MTHRLGHTFPLFAVVPGLVGTASADISLTLTVYQYGSSWIETTVNGPGVLSWEWNIYSEGEELDYLELTVNDEYYDEIRGNWGGCEPYDIYLDYGPNVVRFTYYREEPETPGTAAWLDKVSFMPELDVSISVSIQRSLIGTNTYYYAFPYIDYALPESQTVHEVESPTGAFWADEVSSGSTQFATLKEVIDECLQGPWTFYYNRGAPAERQFTFYATAGSFSSNDLPGVVVSSPTLGSSGVSSNPAYAWSGPTNGYTSLFVMVGEVGQPATGSDFLPVDAVTWSNAPALNVGTNELSVRYTYSDYPDIYFDDPMDDDGNYIDSWYARVDLETEARPRFVVGGATGAQPVRLIGVEGVGTTFEIRFPSQDGTSHAVECRTNMLVGTWSVITNVLGDGTLKVLDLPLGPYFETYYRVVTNP